MSAGIADCRLQIADCRKKARRKPPARLLFRLDYDGISPAILCHADKAFATIFTFEKLGRAVRILAYDQVEARQIAEPLLTAIRLEVFIDHEHEGAAR